MDFSKIGEHAAKHDAVSRQEVPNRVLQYDADFACYEVANLDEPPSKNFRALLRKIDTLRRLSGSQWVNAHVTMGEKSGRESMATVKQYQENRDPDAPIKVRVRELRLLLANMQPSKEFPRIRPAASFFREADDTMCTLQSLRVAELGVQSSIIMSGDKDLWMVQGLHCDPKDGRIWEVSGYGKTEYRDVGNKKLKLVGEGTSWFWHQMIMGDSVDDIPGLERLDNALADHYLPLKTGKARKDGSMACAEAKAVVILQGVKSDTVAFNRVFGAYVAYYGVHATERFLEQAYLLWMQRSYDVQDVLLFLNNVGCHRRFEFTLAQIIKLREYTDRVVAAGAIE